MVYVKIGYQQASWEVGSRTVKEGVVVGSSLARIEEGPGLAHDARRRGGQTLGERVSIKRRAAVKICLQYHKSLK